jgi:hypothetical protein
MFTVGPQSDAQSARQAQMARKVLMTVCRNFKVSSIVDASIMTLICNPMKRKQCSRYSTRTRFWPPLMPLRYSWSAY